MENFSIESLTKASQCMYNLSEQVFRYEKLKKEMKRLTDEKSSLDSRLKTNPYAMSFLWGLIGFPVGTMGMLILGVVNLLIFSLFGAVYHSNNGFASFILMIWLILLIIQVLSPALGYGIATGTAYLIMKLCDYKTSREKKIKEKIKINIGKQRQLQLGIDEMLTIFNSERCVLPYIPIPYQNSLAIRKFGDYFVQGRANSIKEAANLYEQDIRFEQQQRQLRQINNGIIAGNAINAAGMAADVVTDIFFIASFI